jgi:predicted SprT family Zn-dependent metalloprotease
VSDVAPSPANCTAHWMYLTARIQVNLLALEYIDNDDLEDVAVHELCHILVNEMREGELHHEERVVTWLTKAFFWVEELSKTDKV